MGRPVVHEITARTARCVLRTPDFLDQREPVRKMMCIAVAVSASKARAVHASTMMTVEVGSAGVKRKMFFFC